jgi:hypothetical protein
MTSNKLKRKTFAKYWDLISQIRYGHGTWSNHSFSGERVGIDFFSNCAGDGLGLSLDARVSSFCGSSNDEDRTEGEFASGRKVAAHKFTKYNGLARSVSIEKTREIASQFSETISEFTLRLCLRKVGT